MKFLVAGEQEVTYPSRARRSAYRGGIPKTTVDVAQALEAKYELLETFFNVYYDQIIECLNEEICEDLEFEFSGKAPRRKRSEARIEEMFREFIENRNAERVGIPGTPTKAAKRAGRPSFFDTGLFKDNARFWIES